MSSGLPARGQGLARERVQRVICYHATVVEKSDQPTWVHSGYIL